MRGGENLPKECPLVICQRRRRQVRVQVIQDWILECLQHFPRKKHSCLPVLCIFRGFNRRSLFPNTFPTNSCSAIYSNSLVTCHFLCHLIYFLSFPLFFYNFSTRFRFSGKHFLFFLSITRYYFSSPL